MEQQSGYLTVGEMAKKMNVTVRALQYYDKTGLLCPSKVSRGGRRLYTDKDMIFLHQILSLKHLGFSLSDIKNRLIPLDTPEEVAGVLAEQAAALREEIQRLEEAFRELRALRAEVLHMQTVDFKKYADIIVNLQMKNDYYWLIKHFNDTTLDHIRSRFDKDNGAAFMEKVNRLQERAIQLQREGVSPEGEKGRAFAKAFWDMVTEFTGGDTAILSELLAFSQDEGLDLAWKERMDTANRFVEPALGAYFAFLGVNPFEEGKE